MLVEKTDKGVRVTVKGLQRTEEVIPLAAHKGSISKAADVYTEKPVGPEAKLDSAQRKKRR